MLIARVLRSAFLVCAGALLLTACAGTDLGPVSRNVSNVEIMIQQARNDGAAEYAPMELRLAEEQLEEARKALKDEDADKAGRKAEVAMEKARLAQQKARAAKAAEEAKKKEESLEILKQEVERKKSD